MEILPTCAQKLKKFLYSVEVGETLFDVQQKFNVPIWKLIKDNRLNGEVRAGQYIYIDTDRGETFLLLPDMICDKESILSANDVSILYPFQLLYK